MSKKAIKCSRMFDSNTGTVKENVVIFIEGDKITDVIPAAGAKTEGCEVIDLTGKFVTPGLIDGHVHLSMNGQANPAVTRPYETIGDWTLFSLRTAQADLMAGFTSLRACGDRAFVGEAVRDAINRGEVWGPRLMTAGRSIATTGGHADDHWSPYLNDELNTYPGVGDGPDELVECVRYNIKHGADFIKFMATGGVMSKGTTVGAQQMDLEEMTAICETAKMYGCITATHAHGTSGINDAIRAGVTTVEHGMLMDDEGRELMLKMGTTLVPTLIAAERIIVMGPKIGTPQWAIDKANQVYEKACDSFRKCLAMGIPIVFGTDSGTPHNFHGKQAYEFELMVQNGMTATQALTSATKSVAIMMRKFDTVGSIEPGKFADIAAFDGDPMSDITAMTQCSFVMKGGVVYKS